MNLIRRAAISESSEKNIPNRGVDVFDHRPFAQSFRRAGFARWGIDVRAALFFSDPGDRTHAHRRYPGILGPRKKRGRQKNGAGKG